jgi:hypothetical protein
MFYQVILLILGNAVIWGGFVFLVSFTKRERKNYYEKEKMVIEDDENIDS